MKLNEKQLTIIFCVIFIISVLGYYIFSHYSQTPPIVPVTTHVVEPPLPLVGEDKVLVEKVLSEKPAPLPKTDVVTAQQVISPSVPPKPLSGAEEAATKRILGL